MAGHSACTFFQLRYLVLCALCHSARVTGGQTDPWAVLVAFTIRTGLTSLHLRPLRLHRTHAVHFSCSAPPSAIGGIHCPSWVSVLFSFPSPTFVSFCLIPFLLLLSPP